MSTDETHDRNGPATEGVTDEWLDHHPAGAFVRWFPQMEAGQSEIIAHVVRSAGIGPGMTVLDIGCGAGIPALRLAEIVGAGGKVVATDPSAVFIAAVTANARARGLTNVEPVQTGAAGLPFPSGSFDAATCNFGVMFFTDVKAGLRRIRDLLRPGARAAFAAWGPVEDNTFFRPFRSISASYLPEPPAPPPPDAPNPMRFAEAGSLTAALEEAGFQEIREDAPVVEMTWPGEPQGVIDSQLDISRIEERVPPDRHEAMRAELIHAYEPYVDGAVTRLTVRVVIASGQA